MQLSEPREHVASTIVYDIIPSLRSTYLPRSLASLAAADPHDELTALLQATEGLFPPPEVEGRERLHDALMLLIALRANSPEVLGMGVDLAGRYAASTSWLCENLGRALPWFCRRRGQ